MRTREEQIAHLSCAIFNEKPGDIDNCISLAREHILEAEHRAEQRVRTEIARDSERLDWIESHVAAGDRSVLPVAEMDREGDTLFYVSGKTAHSLRRAIDAAREVG